MALEIKQSNGSNKLWSTGSSIVLAIISLIGGAAIFTVAYLGMKNNNGLGSLNQRALDWLIGHRQDQITEIMKAITSVGEPTIFIFIVVGIAILWAIFKKEIWRPLLLVGTVGVASVASKLVKSLTENIRPPQSMMIAPFENDFSFTSGHVTGITIFCLMIGYLICSRNSSVKGFIFWAISTMLAVAAMAVSRLYMGHHWLTDTVGAVGLCLVIFAFAVVIDRVFIRVFKK